MLNRTLCFFVLLLLLSSCIERYFPDEVSSIESRVVIDGLISNDKEIGQKIYVSKSTTIDALGFVPLGRCDVHVYDSENRMFVFNETQLNDGCYLGFIPDSLFTNDNTFKLEVTTPQGKMYTSTIEQLSPVPEIDCVYYEVAKRQTADPLVSYWGAQFYVDFKANSNYGNFYRFEIEESYEYRAQWPIQLYINEMGQRIDGSEDFSFYYCYATDALSEVFTLSTEGFTDNSYIKFPLHAVSNQTQRLAHNYSFLLTQYSLSKTAYTFWNSIRENSQEGESLFGKQPASIKGNIACATHPDESVLGFFGVSSVQQKRLTYLGGIDMPFAYAECTPMIMELLPSYRPLYMMYVEEDGVKRLAVQMTKCVICTERGGTTQKPWFFE